MSSEQRSPSARALAQTGLVRLLWELGDEDPGLIVLGGLVPGLLTLAGEREVPEHLGTTDVDMLLIAEIENTADLTPVERTLTRLGFKADSGEDGWRWHGRVEDQPLTVEFLCDLPSYREGESVRPAGCERLAAANLRGTGYVARDHTPRELQGTLQDGRTVTVTVRFAGLAGYLLSKCVTVRKRALEKDYYDLPYVLLYNHAGGPEQAAQQIRDGTLADALPALTSTLLEVRARYRSTAEAGPVAYAASALRVQPTADAAQLRADAVDAVQRFCDALGL